MTRAQRSALGRIGIQSRLAREDRSEMTEAARARANFGRYYDETPDELPHEERARRAVAARQAHMEKMSLAAAAARRRAAGH
jgi:hypothetical protein